MSQEEWILKPHALKEVSPKLISPNPYNPRMFFQEESLAPLRDSIRQLGILVPLAVYESKQDKRLYLLDGERRWMCANQLGMRRVPVNIVPEPEVLQNIITMFNIHKLREDWELMPTALKLEVIERMLKQQTRKKRIGVSYLAQITGLSRSTVLRCKILLSFPKQYQDMILARGKDTVKTDFFIELYPVLTRIKTTFPEVYASYGKDGLTDKFLKKYREKVISDVIDLRQVQSLIRSVKKGVSKDVVRRSLLSLLDKPSITIDEAYDSTVRGVYEIELIEKLATDLGYAVDNFDSRDPAELEKLRVILKEILERLQAKLSSLAAN